jgi:hypothetical protein
MPRPISVPRWVLTLLLFGAYLTVRGYHSRDGDQAYRLPILLHQQDASLFANDPFVTALDAFNPHRGYLALLDLAARPFGLSFALFALFAATFALTVYGIDRLARSVWSGSGASVGMIAVVLVLLAKAGNIGTNHLFEAMLLDRLIGFALGWVALAMAIDGETQRPSLLVGLATVIHPSVGLQLAMLLGTTWIAWAICGRRTEARWSSVAIGLTTLFAAILPGASATFGLGSRLFEGLSPAEFRSLGVELQMAQHMVPSLWRKPQWLAWGMYLLLAIVALSSRRASRDGGRPVAQVRFAILLGLLILGLGGAYVAIEWVGDLRVTVFQPFRMATIARGLALIAVAGRCQSLWNRGDWLGRFRVALLAASLMGDWAFVVAGLIELAATIFEWGSSRSGSLPAGARGSGWGDAGQRWLDGADRCTNSSPHPEGTRWGGISLVVAAILGAGFLVRHDTEGGQIAIVAAVAIACIAVRLPKRWTSRRLGFASVGCWAFPISAMVAPLILPTDHPIVASLAERCRFGATPTDDIERLAVWCRSNTPADSRFVTPPGPKTFRLWSLRSVAFNRAASPYHARGLKDWSDRFRAHVGYEGTTSTFVRDYLADRHGIEARYARLGSAELAALAESQGADHVIAAAKDVDHPSDRSLQRLKVEGRYAVYRVIGTVASRQATEGRLR